MGKLLWAYKIGRFLKRLKMERKLPLTVNVVHMLLIDTKMYDLEWPLSEIQGHWYFKRRKNDEVQLSNGSDVMYSVWRHYVYYVDCQSVLMWMEQNYLYASCSIIIASLGVDIMGVWVQCRRTIRSMDHLSIYHWTIRTMLREWP